MAEAQSRNMLRQGYKKGMLSKTDQGLLQHYLFSVSVYLSRQISALGCFSAEEIL